MRANDAEARAAIEAVAEAIEADAAEQGRIAENARELGLDGMEHAATAAQAARLSDALRVRALVAVLGV